MGRNPYIGILMRRTLSAMYCPGESKKAYQDETNRLRAKYKAELRKQGYSKKEAHRLAQYICTYKDRIFSSSTLNSYLKATKSFEHFCKETLGTKRISLEEAKKHVQAYIDWGMAKGWSDQTIHLRTSAVCKALGLYLIDYEKPIRHYADTKRSVGPAKNDAYNSVKAEKSLRLAELTGVRRHQLARIKVSDVRFLSDRAEVHTIGKGGLHNVNVLFIEEDISALKTFVDEAIANGQTYLLTKEELNNDADIHSMRAACAKRYYNYFCDQLEQHPEYYEKYVQEIATAFCRAGKTLNEDLSKPYKCRGENRKKLLAQGKETMFNRLCVMMVSCHTTNHFRTNVTIMYYLLK